MMILHILLGTPQKPAQNPGKDLGADYSMRFDDRTLPSKKAIMYGQCRLCLYIMLVHLYMSILYTAYIHIYFENDHQMINICNLQ